MHPSRRLGFSSFVTMAALIGCAPCLASCAKPQVGNLSAAVILLDYSKSYAPYTAQDEAVLGEVNKSISRLIRVNELAQPVKTLWAAFGDNGLQPILPCGPARVFRQAITGPTQNEKKEGVGATETIDNIAELEAWLSACVTTSRSLSQVPHQFTDISGALAFAGNALSDIQGTRIVVLFSDLREDLPIGRSKATPQLENAKIMLIWRPGLDDQKQPSEMQQRLVEWEKRLASLGASKVCARQAQAVTEGDLSSCLMSGQP